MLGCVGVILECSATRLVLAQDLVMEPNRSVPPDDGAHAQMPAVDAGHQLVAFLRWCRFVQLHLEHWLNELEEQPLQVVEQIYPGPPRYVPGYYSPHSMFSSCGEPLASTSTTSTVRGCLRQPVQPDRQNSLSAGMDDLVRSSDDAGAQHCSDASEIIPPAKRFRKRAKAKS